MQKFIATHNESHFPGPICYKRNPFLVMELKILKKQHLTVSNAVQMLNMIFTYLFIKTILIVWACETGKNQAQQISTSIYDAFNSTTDEQIKDELQQFSLQILHCNNTFSAKGLIIDAKLLARVNNW
ncbi:PREDICTED: uncharacterized protein LOC108753963 [Trachymyrmex septentrionalis]|uniref:uncharacterized protein LOC108753963 n=1 Tax=Trachymyrmex septentrionalis TaxID=34720 RepID=UPI00084EFA91|nr:PREDICTED: uncharacterized protein LOC108753963 [Trachymyrmex septentrionalis]